MPLVVSAIPFALVVALAITESGIGNLIGWSSAPIIFAGAAQLTLITLLGTGTAVVAAVSAALVINARHMMYSAALAPTFQKQPKWFRWLGPYALLDQTFALVILRKDDDPKDFRTYYLAASAIFIIFWNITVALGLMVGPVVPESWQLEFAVPVMFVGIVVMSIDRYPKAVAAIVGAGVSYLFAGLPNRSGLLVGALFGIVAGVLADRWSER
ncbi:MAG TPA: AzlC family ABC transporter permease [Acidimicrobiia bacterium]|nr:AzlC family ABC transporter permease [Acidimicrobiia bacterium]